MRDPGSVSCNAAAVESAASRDTDPQPSPFAQRVSREAQRRDVDRAQAEGVRSHAGARGARGVDRAQAEGVPRSGHLRSAIEGRNRTHHSGPVLGVQMASLRYP